MSSREKYWSPLPENGTPDKYADTIAGFFRTTLRCYTGHPAQYGIPLTSAQQDAAKALLAALSTGSQPDDLSEVFHKFSLSLLTLVREGDGVPGWTCPFLCYFAALGLRDDGNFTPAEGFSPELAQFKYFCYTATIVKAYYKRAEHPDGMIGYVLIISSFFTIADGAEQINGCSP